MQTRRTAVGARLFAVIRIEGSETPSTFDATQEAESIANELERRGHRVQRWLAHLHHLESLLEELATEDCALLLIEALVPVDVLRRLPDRIESRPCALFGPLALALLEQAPVAFALVGATPCAAGELADRVAADRLATDRVAADRVATDRVATERVATDPAATDPVATDRVATDHATTDHATTDRVTTDRVVRDLLLEGLNAVPNLFTRASSNRSDSPRIDASSTWNARSHEPELLASSTSAEWRYRGPSRKSSEHYAPILAGLGCMHGRPPMPGATGKAPDQPGAFTPGEAPDESGALAGSVRDQPDALARGSVRDQPDALARGNVHDQPDGLARGNVRDQPDALARGNVHDQPEMPRATDEPFARDLGGLAAAGWSERARERIAMLYGSHRSCPFGICPSGPDIPLEQVYLQAEQLWNQGVRSFEIRVADPIPILGSLLEKLSREERAPDRIRFRPSPRVLRQCEKQLIPLLEAYPQVRFELSGLEFFLAGRPLGQPRHDTSQWEARSIARLLRRLTDRAPNLDATSGHELYLFDPYTTLEEILDALQVIEEDAPFLKGQVSANRPLLIGSRFSPIARQIIRAGLLSLDGPYGLGYRFASDEIPVYRDLVARGLAPLLEAVGRLRRPPQERDRLAIEGRFRWFRELARFVISRRGSDRPATDGWGQVLASVTGELGLDQIRRR